MKRTRKKRVHVPPMGGFFTNPPEECAFQTVVFGFAYTDMCICHFACPNKCEEYLEYNASKKKRGGHYEEPITPKVVRHRRKRRRRRHDARPQH